MTTLHTTKSNCDVINNHWILKRTFLVLYLRFYILDGVTWFNLYIINYISITQTSVTWLLSWGLQGVMRPWFDFCFWRYIHCLLVYVICFPTYLFLRVSTLTYLFLWEQIGSISRPDAIKGDYSWLNFFVLQYISFDWWMCAFAEISLDFAFAIPSQEIGLGNVSRNDLFCAEWDIKPQLNQSINHYYMTDVKFLSAKNLLTVVSIEIW